MPLNPTQKWLSRISSAAQNHYAPKKAFEWACEPRNWLVSLLAHSLLAGTLLCFHFESVRPVLQAEVVSDLLDDVEQEEFAVLINDVDSLDAPDPDVVSLAPSTGELAVESAEPLTAVDPAQSPSLVASDKDLFRPLAHHVSDMNLSDTVTGLKGANVNAGGQGGSVDRITVEILRRLEHGKVMVAWLLDASESLNRKREQVVARFERIYKELDVLGTGGQSDVLVAGVAAFGETTNFVLDKPSPDPKAVLDAVRSIKPDHSGAENVFTAVRDAAQRWRRMKTGGGYELMIVVLTDEMGDDDGQLESTVTMVKRFRIPVYVMGPMAPFGRGSLTVPWTDPESGQEFHLPVDRGPETVDLESARVPTWYKGKQFGLFWSGFGPYALSRVARESGGLYLLLDDDLLPGPRFDPDLTAAYAPNYSAAPEYRKQAAGSPLRSTVLEIARASQQKLPELQSRFLSAGIQFKIRDAQRELASAMTFLDASLTQLKAVEKHRSKETSLRWLAHVDLLTGRLAAARLRCERYQRLLDQMYVKPLANSDRTKNAWELAGDEKATLADVADPPTTEPSASEPAKERPGPRETSEKGPRLELAALAHQRLTRVVQEHEGTPWAAVAQSELEFPVGFKWQEGFMTPPKGVKLPWDKVPWEELTEKEKKAKRDFEERQKKAAKKQDAQKDVKKRIPKL